MLLNDAAAALTGTQAELLGALTDRWQRSAELRVQGRERKLLVLATLRVAGFAELGSGDRYRLTADGADVLALHAAGR